MPELPEVETVRRGLLPVLEGKCIESAVQNRLDLRWPLPERFAERLTGRRVEQLSRRAKYLLAYLDANETMLIHLGMSGRLLVSTVGRERDSGAELHHAAKRDRSGAGKHDHVVLEIEGGARVVFNDARRFGAMDLWPSDSLHTHPLLARLGPEPLSNAFSAEHLTASLEGKRSAIKSALLDQRIVAGLGNIYVCEALFGAKISPERASGSLSPQEVTALTAEIRGVLEAAIEAGGSSLRDFHGASGELGYFQHSFRVYGREGQGCARDACDGVVERLVQSARSSFYCSRCQR